MGLDFENDGIFQAQRGKAYSLSYRIENGRVSMWSYFENDGREFGSEPKFFTATSEGKIEQFYPMRNKKGDSNEKDRRGLHRHGGLK